MNSLDSLNLIVTASTSQATKSIDTLIDTLGKLSNAFDIQSVDGFAASLRNMSNAINSIKGYNLKVVSEAVSGLAKAGKSMAAVSQSAAKTGTAVDSLTKKLADIVNITDKTGLSMLKKEVDSFLHSTNGDEMANSRSRIMTIAKTFGTVGAEIDKDREKALEFINALNNTKINLPKDWTKEFGDTDYAKKLRGLIGLGRTVADGSGSDASEIAERLGLGDYKGQDAEAFRDIAVAAEMSRNKIAETNDEMMTLGDALRSDGEAAREAADAMNAFNEKLANALGLTKQQMNTAFSGGDGFLDDYEKQNIAMETFMQNAERLIATGNPYQNIADGLNDLGRVNIPPETISNVEKIRDAVQKIGNKSGANAGVAMKGIAEGLQSLNVPVPEIGDKVAELAVGLRKLGSSTVVNASQALPFIAQSLHHLNSLQMSGNAKQIAELAQAVAAFGYAKVDKAAQNIPVLTQELVKMINALSKAPQVANSTVELVKALGAMNVSVGKLPSSTKRAGHALDMFSKKANKAHRSAFSLAATIGKIYASYWMIIRLMGMFKSSIDIASDLTEVQNVVDHTFGQMKNQMEDFAKVAVETVGMNELTAKKIGSRFQGMAKAMSISPEMMRNASEFTDKVTNGYAKASDSVSNMSINLTKLAGDMASFYNLDYSDVAEDLEAVLTGMTRPLRKYGIDLTVASMKEFALANGLNADIKNMSQAEKTMLRYQMVMARTTAAQGDFIRTQDTWANQTRIAGENLKKLQVILGQIGIYSFKPLVKSFNSAMNDILHLAESTFNSLGTIFGWQIEITDVGIIDDMADGLEDVADGYGDADDAGKKFKNFLLGIDELNLLPDNSDKKKGDDDATGLGALANGYEDSLVKFKPIEKGFDSLYDTLFKLGKRIGEVQLDFLKGIDWQSVYDKVEKGGRGLADFLNGYLSDAELFYHKGRFIANGINTVARAVYGFFHEFDGYQLGKDLGFELNGLTRNLDWDVIKSAAYEMSHDIAETVNGLFENVNWYDVGRTIIEGINTAVRFVSTIWNEIHWDIIGRSIGVALNSMVENWDHEEMARLLHGKIQALFDLANNLLNEADFEQLGQTIGKFLTELHIEEFADDIALLIWNVIKAALQMLPKMFEEAPLETALILGIAGFKFNNFGISLGGALGGSTSKQFAKILPGLLKTDLAAIQYSAGLTGAAEMIGVAFGEAFVAAAVAYIAYNLTIELGRYFHPDDAMWYKPDAWLEAASQPEWWGLAFGEMQSSATKNAVTGGDDNWNSVLESLRRGQKEYTDKDLEEIKEYLKNQRMSEADINELMNQLKDARDEYYNGFKPWLESQDDIQYALANGVQYKTQILDEAYDKYLVALEKEEEMERKREELYNSPENQRQRYNAQQERIAAYNEEIAAWNGLSAAQQNFARISGNVPEHILDFQKPDVYENASKAINKFAGDAGSFAKNTTNALQTAVDGLFKIDFSIFEVKNNAVGAMKEMEDAFGRAENMGSGVFSGEARNIENLNTKLILTKTGLERITTAIDEIGNRKDKTRTLHDAFDGVKGKVEEVGNLFTMENMDNMFSAIPKAFRMAWQDAVNIMKSVWAEMANWINQNAQLEIPKVKVGNQELGGQKVRVQVPRFDVGGSIPNNGNLFFANESGAEVVANMGSRTGVMNTDQMEAAIANGMMKALAANGQNVTVVLEGDASSFFSAMVKENNNAIMRVGASPLRV